ncbi:MAG: polysaccharide deacetylase family protein [Pseudomonadales bacterium]
MRRLVEGIAAPIEAVGLFTLLESLERDTGRLRVLTYHRVAETDEEPDLEPGLISATPAGFRAEMQLLAQRYSPVSLEDVLAAHRGSRPLPKRAVLVTFDDGYRDFATNAWPVMKELGIPVVLFVPTAYPSGERPGFWWDRLHAAITRTTRDVLVAPGLGEFSLATPELRRAAYKRLRNHVKSLPHTRAMTWVEDQVASLAELPDLNRVLSWDELRALAAEGVSLCSHSRDHALLTRLDPRTLMEDLRESQSRLNDELGAHTAPATLAYPANAANGAVRQAARDAGYVLCFGGARGLNRVPLADTHELKRLPVLRYGMGLYRAQLRPSLSLAGGALSTIRGRLRA